MLRPIEIVVAGVLVLLIGRQTLASLQGLLVMLGKGKKQKAKVKCARSGDLRLCHWSNDPSTAVQTTPNFSALLHKFPEYRFLPLLGQPGSIHIEGWRVEA
jgi:hypothetical protein